MFIHPARYSVHAGVYELYGLLNEAIHNEIFIKRGKYYYYTFWEAHQKYLSKNTPEEVVQTSQEVLAYFEGRRVDDAQICLGLIQNASMAQDPLSERAARRPARHRQLQRRLSERPEQDRPWDLRVRHR